MLVFSWHTNCQPTISPTGVSRTEATELIESQGGRITSGVSKATTVVVVGDDAGSKLEKAVALGIETIDEAELRRRCET